ncbi:MAG: TonB-dependent receptor, partial [Chitinophagaceae bacterium]
VVGIEAFYQFAGAQTGTVEGSVSESGKNTGLGNVSVEIIETSSTKVTNQEGRFSFELTTGKAYTLRVSSVGFQTKEISGVEVSAGKVTTVDIVLERQAKTEEVVVVRASARKETVNAMIAYQKNTNTVAQVVSAESIKRSPDRNTGEVLKRIPGTSIQEGKYLVVRGLADRYNQAMLNGVLLSSTEPDRKTFSFDIFPSSIVDNIIVNKAFVPELPGEWAGGIIQVNTKDVPARNFLQVQVGTGFNTQTIGKDFYAYQGGKTDFLGYDDGTRGLAAGFPVKGAFNNMSNEEKIRYGLTFSNVWTATPKDGNVLPVLNQNIQITGGFKKNLGRNKLSAILGANYNRSNKRLVYRNSIYSVQNNQASLNFDYFNTRYSQDVLAGAIANFALELGRNHKISFRNILNVNTTNYSTMRSGKDFESNSEVGDNIRAAELAFKANTFFNTQIGGDHYFPKLNSKFNWFGSFNILDQYVPDQRRLQYNQDDPTDPNSPYSLLIGASRTSQKSGSRYFGFLNDYNYTAGGNLSYDFSINGVSQTVKGGYLFQVKDRLFNSRPFAIYLPSDNPNLRHLDASVVFNPENFGNGFDNKFAFNEISDSRYRYVANSILNAAYIQFDNNFSEILRMVWGARVEHFDQVVGSMKRSDPRHFYSKKTDLLPGINVTYKLDRKTNIRLSASKTVIRPEFRELSSFAFYDFDMGATITGEPRLERTRVANADLRYELYPGAGELFTVGLFYKFFDKPIELYFNQSG